MKKKETKADCCCDFVSLQVTLLLTAVKKGRGGGSRFGSPLSPVFFRAARGADAPPLSLQF
jgi:hypothetical protein